LNGGIGVRMIAPPERVVVVKARLMVVTSSRSLPGSWPMNTTEAMSRVSSLTAGMNRNRLSLTGQSLATTDVATVSIRLM
jgi:hypothetical protein